MDESFELEVMPTDEKFGYFATPEFNASCLTVTRAIRDRIAANLGRRMVVTDVDWRFYANVALDLLAVVEDEMFTPADRIAGGLVRCTAIQSFIASERIVQFYDTWLVECANPKWAHVQESFNALLESFPGLRTKVLDPEKFWTIGLGYLVHCPWTPGDPVPAPPATLAMHHANYTVGAADKLILLEKIRDMKR